MTPAGRATIFALSSGAPPAAIAVVRVTGPDSGPILRQIAGPLPEPRRQSLRPLRDMAGMLLDQALVSWFPGPATVTGEDMAELHLHGGRAVIAAVEAALAELGAKPAEAGAFTRRAFENNRLDLAEVEGLADLLRAETELQRRAALASTTGLLSRRVEDWRQRLLSLSALVEAEIEFAEDDIAIDSAAVEASLNSLGRDIFAALEEPSAELLRDGVRVVICGRPNSGKSTLLNRIVEREAAITSPIAGTTRDLVEVPVAIDGVPLVFVDTAGLRDGRGAIERAGIERAIKAAATADLLILLDDSVTPQPGAASLRVHAKADLGASVEGEISVSAATGYGIAELKCRILDVARELLPPPAAASFNRRQRALLADIGAALDRALSAPDPLLRAEELAIARRTLDALTGRAGVEDMLDSLFADFCIGK